MVYEVITPILAFPRQRGRDFAEVRVEALSNTDNKGVEEWKEIF